MRPNSASTSCPPHERAPVRLSIDVGGTFTDLVLIDDAGGRTLVDKVPSTPGSARAVIESIDRITRRAGTTASDLDLLLHGFTIATNAWLTRTGSRVVLLTTAGFRDVLALGSQRRPRHVRPRGGEARTARAPLTGGRGDRTHRRLRAGGDAARRDGNDTGARRGRGARPRSARGLPALLLGQSGAREAARRRVPATVARLPRVLLVRGQPRDRGVSPGQHTPRPRPTWARRSGSTPKPWRPLWRRPESRRRCATCAATAAPPPRSRRAGTRPRCSSRARRAESWRPSHWGRRWASPT